MELGGWDWLHTWTNPPGEFLEQEIERFPDWLVWHTLISPKLAVREASAAALGDGTYRVQLVVENTGWLPTSITKKALERKLRGVVCEIELPKGAKLEAGKSREQREQLDGRAYKNALTGWSDDSTTDRLRVEWVVRAPQGGKVKLTARHERAGTVRAAVNLK